MGNTEIIVAIIGAGPPTAAIIVGVVLAIRKITGVRDDVQAVHVSVNSRLTELLETTAALSHAQGVQEGREE